MIRNSNSVVPVPRATLAMGAVGAVVGGFVAAARNCDKVQAGTITRDEAIRDVVKESGTTGLATATGTAVMSALPTTGLVSLLGMVVVAVGTKRVADRMIGSTSCCSNAAPIEVADARKPEAEEPVKVAPKKKKTTRKSKTEE